jgi:broad specificity phosphatase PhoE
MGNTVLLGQAVFFRHGQTEYTDEYPDLTEEGKATIGRTGSQIAQMVNGHKVTIVSSPLARTRGSANIVAGVIGYREKIHIDPLIRAADIYDPQASWAMFEEYHARGGIHEVSRAYFSDPRYDEGLILETKVAIQERFSTYLGRLISKLFEAKNHKMFVISVSHYEVLYAITEKLFHVIERQQMPLSHGEVVLIKFLPTGDGARVILEVYFRSQIGRAIFYRQTNQLAC